MSKQQYSPCPFCGGTEIDARPLRPECKLTYVVCCRGCNGTAPIEKWNNRYDGKVSKPLKNRTLEWNSITDAAWVTTFNVCQPSYTIGYVDGLGGSYFELSIWDGTKEEVLVKHETLDQAQAFAQVHFEQHVLLNTTEAKHES